MVTFLLFRTTSTEKGSACSTPGSFHQPRFMSYRRGLGRGGAGECEVLSKGQLPEILLILILCFADPYIQSLITSHLIESIESYVYLTLTFLIMNFITLFETNL